MKRRCKIYCGVCMHLMFLVLHPLWSQAQEHWPADYRVSRWLDRLPAGNKHQLDGMLSEFFNGGSANVNALISNHLVKAKLVTTPLDYAITSLFRYTGQADHEVERSLLINALVNQWDAIQALPVKKYLLQEMQFVHDARLAPLIAQSLGNQELRQDAILAMVGYPDRKLNKLIKKGLKAGDPDIWIWASSHAQEQFHPLLWKKYQKAEGEQKELFLKTLALQGNPKDSLEMSKLSAVYPGMVLHYLERVDAHFFPVSTANALIGAGDATGEIKCEAMHELFLARPLYAFNKYGQWVLEGPCGATIEGDLTRSAMKSLDDAIQHKFISDSSDSKKQRGWIRILAGRGGFSNARFLKSLTGKEDPDVRIDALLAWSRVAGAESMPYLTDWFFHTRDSLRQEVAWPLIREYTDGGNMKSLADRIAFLTPHFRIKLLDLISDRQAGACFSQVYYQTQQNDTAVARQAWRTLAVIAEPQHDALMHALIREAPDNIQSEVAESLLNTLHSTEEKENNWKWIKENLDANVVIALLIQHSEEAYAQKVIDHLEQNPALTTRPLVKMLLEQREEEALRVLLWIAVHHETMRTMVMDEAVPQVRRIISGAESQRLWLVDWLEASHSQHERDVVFQQLGNLPGWSTFKTLTDYFTEDNLKSLAYIRAVAGVCLPAQDHEGLSGQLVKQTLQQLLPEAEQMDHQESSAIETYLNEMPQGDAFQELFNGIDLTGWQGWFADPYTLKKLSVAEKKIRQEEADQKMQQHWKAKDGMIVFSGEGANLVTKKWYKDFELHVDWKITKDGDSGIYLRGYPQVQIWDTSRVDVGAQVGSGGLYNNQRGFSTPLTVADRPVGSWNHFFVRMLGGRVTVYLNDVMVVNDVQLENYWDRNLPVLSEGPIELQAHGTDLAFRDLLIREIDPVSYTLTQEEIDHGYQALFNGMNLDNWIGNTTDYQVRDGVIDVDPSRGGEGNLYTVDTFSNFSLRFEFQLTPGANNGIGIHTPLTGDAAYVGKEIQVLDNTDTIYDKLQPYQYHGSVYGVIPARQGYLKGIGQWNEEEIRVDGDHVRVTLNGEVITESNVKEWTEHGTMDHKDHPGLQRHSGHIGFLGHGSPLKFRNVRILRL